MKNIAITCTKKTAIATYLPYAAYKRALELATELKGEIGKTAEGNFMATFAKAKTAEKFVATWTADYEANRKPVTESTPAQKPSASKGKTKTTASSTKKKTAPRKSKGDKPTLNDFVIANPSCTRDEAKAYGFKGTRADLKALKVALGVR